jgi:16S rRNA (cytosine1402-N4)-methyltransferase
MGKWFHIPVLLTEVIEYIDLKDGGTYADLTFGEGGHSEVLLDKGAKEVWAMDRDSSALELYSEEGRYAKDQRLILNHGRFSTFADLPEAPLFDGILLDLGVSTRQLTQKERGFTFQEKGPLDMRMDQTKGPTLKELLESLSEEEIADILYYNADLRTSRSLARRIKRAVQDNKIESTQDLASLFGGRMGKSHPATVPFMALRMAVNQEIEEITQTLPRLVDMLKPGGRLVVITFHSTEDRCVKRLFKQLAGLCTCDSVICLCSKLAKVKILTKKPIEPSEDELKTNPRSRSAKLRCIEKIS